MNINIAQNRPLIRQLKRIADALERMNQLSEHSFTISDPASEDDVSFTDEESDYLEEKREERAKIRTELEKAGFPTDVFD